MERTAFIFPGQGSQYVGMAKDLYENNVKVQKQIDEAEDLLDFPLKDICFEGPEKLLTQSQYTQPAIFVHSAIVDTLVKQKGLYPEAVAGHSLGEYSALYSAGVLNFEDALNLVKIRGALMQEAGEENPGTMAAIIGLDSEKVVNLCNIASSVGIVKPANFNSPGQIVISGSVQGVERAMMLAKEAGARIVKKLPVSGAFHSPLMEGALGGLVDALENAPFDNPEVPVYTNVNAEPETNPEKLRLLAQKGLLSPVRWEDIIKNMVKNGIHKSFELGPGKVLCGLNKRIDQEFECQSFDTQSDLEKLN